MTVPRGLLTGIRVVVTRPAGAADPLCALLEAEGAAVRALPLTRIEPLDPAPLHAALGQLDAYRLLCFTSANAVRLTMEAARAAGTGDALARLRTAAVGYATAEALAREGLRAAVAPARSSQEGLLEALAAEPLAGARVLFPTAAGARDMLPEGLRAMGAEVDVVRVYRSAPDERNAAAVRALWARGEVDVVTLLAPSAVAALAAGAPGGLRVATIGPLTSDAARRAGMQVVAEAEPATAEGLVAALREWCGGHWPVR